jgi:hypothetical protein
MPPGLEYLYWCPNGTETPLTPWLAMIWATTYALGAETLALGFGILVWRSRQVMLRSAPVSLSLVTGCALAATAVALWLAHVHQGVCMIPLPAHITPDVQAQWRQLYGSLLAQAQTSLEVGLGVVGCLFIIGTTLTVRTLLTLRHGRPIVVA